MRRSWIGMVLVVMGLMGCDTTPPPPPPEAKDAATELDIDMGSDSKDVPEKEGEKEPAKDE